MLILVPFFPVQLGQSAKRSEEELIGILSFEPSRAGF
jgi:hypothetical protein